MFFILELRFETAGKKPRKGSKSIQKSSFGGDASVDAGTPTPPLQQKDLRLLLHYRDSTAALTLH